MSDSVTPGSALAADLSKYVIEVPNLFHVGNLGAPPPEKRSSLYVTRGLFVSQHPDAWEAIAKLGGNPTWSVRRQGGDVGEFLDWLEVPAAVRESVNALAVEMGLLERCDLFEYRWFDDEMDSELSIVFYDREKAMAEACDDEDAVRTVAGYRPTETLLQIWREHFEGDYPSPHAAMQLAQELAVETLMPALDGIWWDEDLDIYRYSAPQGTIFASRLQDWTWEIVADVRLRQLNP